MESHNFAENGLEPLKLEEKVLESLIFAEKVLESPNVARKVPESPNFVRKLTQNQVPRCLPQYNFFTSYKLYTPAKNLLKIRVRL